MQKLIEKTLRFVQKCNNDAPIEFTNAILELELKQELEHPQNLVLSDRETQLIVVLLGREDSDILQRAMFPDVDIVTILQKLFPALKNIRRINSVD